MRTHRQSVFGVATMVVILLATGLVARLADVAMASAVQVTSVGGGGLLTPDNLVGAVSATSRLTCCGCCFPA
jgi:hypothetical protein